LEAPVEAWRTTIVNDFETSVFALYPQLRQLKERIYACGATYASMSGSGSALFGLFDHDPGDLTSAFPTDCLLHVSAARV
jgi:4-diphosphocytidyl-2-C-methyl-D-erythritol kinase